MGLSRHDGEVHDVFTDDDAVLELCVCRRARHAQAHALKRRLRHGVPRGLYLRLLRHFELAGRFFPSVDDLQEGHRRRASLLQMPTKRWG